MIPASPERFRTVGIVLAVAALASGAVGCAAKVPQEPLQLAGNLLTVANDSSEDWTAVEIWLNRQYRMTVPKIAAGGRFQVSLDAFVAGWGQRFDRRRAQITDLRLAAKQPDGGDVNLTYRFQTTGLEGVLERFGGKQ